MVYSVIWCNLVLGSL